jgi:UDP-N-acetylglucosamine 4,6-dehydratase
MTILITGGTGTLGKALTCKYKDDHKVIIYSRDEFKQSEIQKHITDPKDHIRYFIGDVRDENRLITAMKNVDVVIHAAAMKQMPACEYNPTEAVQTNIIGTMKVIQAALNTAVKKVLLISTDKAVNPINLYGATKFSAEKLVLNANQYSGWKQTAFACVRYGNVTGSRGSVIDVFRDNQSGVYPITDTAMTRFWMTPTDAVELVDYAVTNMAGGEVFIPKMWAYNITTLALALNEQAKFDIIGIREGEKIHEEMLNENDKRNIYDCGQYYCINYGKKLYPNSVSPFEYTSATVDKIDKVYMRKLLEGM